MNLNPLPSPVTDMLESLNASPRLVAHLRLVHDSAVQITEAVSKVWPDISYDRQAVLIGAAIHDIGKIAHPEELTQSGNQHEQTGPDLLIRHDIPSHLARFARTHGQWRDTQSVEDLLVALADKIWKGTRDDALEDAVVEFISRSSSLEKWQVFSSLDNILVTIAEAADERLSWQAQHPLVR